jgi:hypothetical protein
VQWRLYEVEGGQSSIARKKSFANSDNAHAPSSLLTPVSELSFRRQIRQD